MGKGRGFLGRSQLFELHPLALAYLVLAGVDVKGHWLQTTDEVKVREVVIVGQTVLLAEGHDRLELYKKYEHILNHSKHAIAPVIDANIVMHSTGYRHMASPASIPVSSFTSLTAASAE